MGPRCLSSVITNGKICQTNLGDDFRGDEGYKPVQVGDLLATVSAFLMVLAYMRGVHVAIENPPGNTIWKFSPMKEAIQICGCHSVVTPRCAWSMEVLGKRMNKYFPILSLCTLDSRTPSEVPVWEYGTLAAHRGALCEWPQTLHWQAGCAAEVGGLSPCVGEWPYSGMVPAIQQLGGRSTSHR